MGRRAERKKKTFPLSVRDAAAFNLSVILWRMLRAGTVRQAAELRRPVIIGTCGTCR
jgi:hypothetical protein